MLAGADGGLYVNRGSIKATATVRGGKALANSLKRTVRSAALVDVDHVSGVVKYGSEDVLHAFWLAGVERLLVLAGKRVVRDDVVSGSASRRAVSRSSNLAVDAGALWAHG